MVRNTLFTKDILALNAATLLLIFAVIISIHEDIWRDMC